MEELTTITEEFDDQSSVKSNGSCGSNRVKFLCRYEGRILPRPGDGKLRYAGGNTRVVAASRSIAFADLIAKMSKVFGSALLLKCQLPCEDLDTLVSIKSDEDLENTLEEYDSVGAREGLSKVRAFLFALSISPSKPLAAGHMDGHPSAESIIVEYIKPQDDSQVAVSIPDHREMSQWLDPHRFQCYPSRYSPPSQNHRTNQFSTRRFHPHQHHAVQASAKNSRPWTGVPTLLQYSGQVRYMNLDVMKKPLPQHKLLCVDESFSARMVHRDNAPQVGAR